MLHRLIHSVQHSPPCLHAQTLLLTGVLFCFFFSFIPEFLLCSPFLQGCHWMELPVRSPSLFSLPPQAPGYCPHWDRAPLPSRGPFRGLALTNKRGQTPHTWFQCTLSKEKRLSRLEMQQDRPAHCYKLVKRCPLRGPALRVTVLPVFTASITKMLSALRSSRILEHPSRTPCPQYVPAGSRLLQACCSQHRWPIGTNRTLAYR